jgi:hypothetical protein
MVAKWMVMNRRSRFHTRTVLMLAVTLFLLWVVPRASAQDQSQAPPPNKTQDNGKPKQEVPAEAGGPTDNVGPYAIPKKNPDAVPPPPPPRATAPPVEGLSDYSIKVNVPLVNVDVLVNAKNNGQFIPGLKQENFRIFEDGSPQQITNFNVTQAPITAVLLLEFASTNFPLLYDTLTASYTFANTMKKEDWVAVSYYDMQPHILVDFTQD